MKGTYQEEETLMKFTPEAAGMSDAYQIQHYSTPSVDIEANESESNDLSDSDFFNVATFSL